MAETNTSTAGTNSLNSSLSNHEHLTTGIDISQIKSRYDEERDKRLRDDSATQYIEPSLIDQYRHLQNDPWADATAITNVEALFPNNYSRFVIFGGGFAGVQYAIRLIEAGFPPSDIRIVDPAGGLGGTWYWNRYPGLMCDVESYIYLPRLEQTKYTPRHRYAYGQEIRHYINLLAEKWDLLNSLVLRTKGEHLSWDEASKQWNVELLQQRPGDAPRSFQICSQFVIISSGPLNWPKLPSIPGLLDYKGQVFHSARWNYDLTGGSQEKPELTKLQDKRVAIVGTGATAVQIVPDLAKWAKHLYVVQRTPSSVDTRDQRETDADWFRREVATGAGWQRERNRNFHQQFTTEAQPEVNLVDDGWTRAPVMVAACGNPDGPKSIEELPDYMKKLHALDLTRQQRVRNRVKEVVKDSKTADKLQAWYPTWCKRPCFHDDFLPAFNKDNVSLIDTDGKGIEALTANCFVVNGKSYPVDMIIFATGFRAPFQGSPAETGNMTITGRNGTSISEAWTKNGPTTLHGIIDHNMPNLFLSGSLQAALSPTNTFSSDALAEHAAYIIAESDRKAGGKPFVISATKSATEDWGNQILMRAAPMGAMAGCTPGYYNMEGMADHLPAEVQMMLARSGLWGLGVEDFVSYLEKWRSTGDMAGIQVDY